MKKMMKRKLLLGREVVVALLSELQDARMQDARGGVIVAKSAWAVGAICSANCGTIDK